MMINKKALSERDICTKFITPAIDKAGWDKFEVSIQLCCELEKNINQDKEQTNLLLQKVLMEALNR